MFVLLCGKKALSKKNISRLHHCIDKTFFPQQSLKIKTKREECSTRNNKEISKTNACNYLENSYQI